MLNKDEKNLDWLSDYFNNLGLQGGAGAAGQVKITW